MTLKKRLLALCMAVVMVFSLCSISAFAAAPTDDKQPVVIGRYDAPLSECLEPGMAMQVGIANVRVNSYATYDKNDGVQVHVELYVPWYSSPKPEFTGMTGNVKLTMNGQSTSKYFSEVATGDETISTDVDTGRKASSGTSGTVFVSGTAVALNAFGKRWPVLHFLRHHDSVIKALDNGDKSHDSLEPKEKNRGFVRLNYGASQMNKKLEFLAVWRLPL